MKLWLVVLNFNGWGDTEKCLESLRPSVADGLNTAGIHVVLVDNASAEALPEDLMARYPWLHVKRNRTNEGYAGGNNRGIEVALAQGADWIVLLNNDTIVRPDFGATLLAAAAAAETQGFGVWGPIVRHMDEPDVTMSDGVLFNRAGFPGFFERLPVEVEESANGSGPRFVETDIVNGCCLAMSAAIVSRIGLIDEGLFLVHEESDFCLRAWEAGTRCGVLTRALVWHKGSSAFVRTGRAMQRYFDARNLWYLVRRRPRASARGRSRFQSSVAVLRYVYHRYSHEIEGGQTAAARAVVEGLYDAFAGVQGPYGRRSRPALWSLSAAMNAAHASMRMLK